MGSGDGDAGHRPAMSCPIDGSVNARLRLLRRARADGPQRDRVAMLEQIVAPRLCIAVADHLIVVHEPQWHAAAAAHLVPLIMDARPSTDSRVPMRQSLVVRISLEDVESMLRQRTQCVQVGQQRQMWPNRT